MPIHLRTLGRLVVDDEDGEMVDISRQPVRAALLVYLGMEREVTRESALACVWSDRNPVQARHALSQTLYELRCAFGEEWLRTEGEYLRATTDFEVDALAFADAVEGGDPAGALALHGGAFLEGCHLFSTIPFEGWVDRQRGRLERLYRRARRGRIEQLVADGDLAAALAVARDWVDTDPLEDGARHEAIRLLAATGRRAEALHDYEEYVRLLSIEGLEPLEETSRLVERIRSSDAGVDRPLVAESRSAVRAATRAMSRRWSAILATALALIAALLMGHGVDPVEVTVEPRRVAVLPFENLTGDASLEPLGRWAADWVSRGLSTTGRMDLIPSLMVVQRPHTGDAGLVAAPTGTGTIVSGRFYRRGEEVEFHVEVVDVDGDEVWAKLDPIRAPIERPAAAIEEIHQRVKGILASRFTPGIPLEPPSILHPPTYEAYVEYVEGGEAFLGGDYRGSIPHLERAFALDSTFVRPLLVAASAHMNMGERAAADSIARRVAARDPERLAPYERAHIRWLRATLDGDRVGAYRAVLKIAEIAPGWPASYLAPVIALGVNEPERTLEMVENWDPDAPWKPAWGDAHPLIVDAHHVLGRYETELAVAREARRFRPQSADAVFREARALLALGRLDEMDEVLSEARGLPEEGSWSTGEIYRRVAAELRAHGDDSGAARVLHESLEWHVARSDGPEPPEPVRLSRARALLDAARPVEAERLLEPLHSADPGDLAVVGALGVAAAARGDVERAEALSERLSAVDPRYRRGEPSYRRATIAARLGRYDEAVDLLRRSFSRGRDLGPRLHADSYLEPLVGFPAYKAFLQWRPARR